MERYYVDDLIFDDVLDELDRWCGDILHLPCDVHHLRNSKRVRVSASRPSFATEKY